MPLIVHGYRCKHFKLQELVEPTIYRERGERAWEMLDPCALMTLDSLRDEFGALELNNWHEGGDRDEAGLRRFGTSTGAEFSMHKYGRGFDPRSRFVTPQEIFDRVMAKAAEKFQHIRAVENVAATPTWFHFDTRNHNRPGIWVVNP